MKKEIDVYNKYPIRIYVEKYDDGDKVTWMEYYQDDYNDPFTYNFDEILKEMQKNIIER